MIEPTEVIQLVDGYIDEELSDADRFDNRDLFDDSGIYALHVLAAEIYARGIEDGRRQERQRQQGAAARELSRRHRATQK